jgi:hypothetical protein
MLLQLACLITLLAVTDLDSHWAFIVMSWLATACFGGGMSVLPGFVTKLFGAQSTGVCRG